MTLPRLDKTDEQDRLEAEAEDADQERRAIFLDEAFPLKILEMWGNDADIALDFSNLPELVDIEYNYWLPDRLEQERGDPGSRPSTRYFEPITKAEWWQIYFPLDGFCRETDSNRMWLKIAAFALKQARES